MSVPVRFREDEQPRWLADGRYLVSCPRCGQLATVECIEHGQYGWSWRARATCAHCGFADEAQSSAPHWRGPVIVRASARCGYCGRPLRRLPRRQASLPRNAQTTLRCPGCGHGTRVPVRVEPATGRLPVEPYFGLALWLQTSCEGEVIWAVNEAHLTFLMNYVGAMLREREPNRNSSPVSRLPGWMKHAKNRSALLACLERLRRTLVEPELCSPAV